MTLDEKVAQLETIWEQKGKVDAADGVLLARASLSKNFPDGIGGFARPSDYRGVDAVERRGGRCGRDRQPRRATDRGVRQCGAALGGRAYAARNPDPDARGVAARLCRARRDQLPAGDRARKHVGPASLSAASSRSRRARRARAARRSSSPRSSTSRAIPAGAASRRPTARTPISSTQMGLGGGPRIPGSDAAASGRQGVRDAEAFHRPRLARERHQCRPRASRRTRASRDLLPAVRSRREDLSDPLGHGLVQ